MSTPYQSLDSSAFWKTAVAQALSENSPFQFDLGGLGNPTGRYASLGSCFAQHVGRHLSESDANFSLSGLSTIENSSFAFGNIYTPRELLQWLDEGSLVHAHTVLSTYQDPESGKVFDLLRPSENGDGFEDLDRLMEMRAKAVAELKSTVANIDTLVFTLGLTESWKDREGIHYPVCPGTVVGKFDEAAYQFHNFSYQELLEDVRSVVEKLRAINPKLELILTVSPVPLTATASGKHVLVANTHSKSTLRAVASTMVSEEQGVFYFPSYELMTHQQPGDPRYLDNLRQVNESGVARVMACFKSSLGVSDLVTKTDKTIDEVCDEELLEIQQQVKGDDIPIKQLTLIGDSQLGKLSSAFDELGIEHAGGMIMNGSGFSDRKFALCPEEYFVPLENAASRTRWLQVLRNLDGAEKSGEPSTVICNIGMQTHRNVTAFTQWFERQKRDPSKLSLNDFIDFFNQEQIDQIRILAALVSKGHKLIMLSDPPFFYFSKDTQHLAQLFAMYYDAMGAVAQKIGASFYFNGFRLFMSQKLDPKKYQSDVIYQNGQRDWIHGNSDFYTWVAQYLRSNNYVS